MSGNSTTSNSGGGGGNGSGGGGPCGACKFLRRKCVTGCVFAPYFDAEAGAGHFAAVHRVFGASNASKLLQRVPAHRRLHAVLTMCYEAHARLRDPVFGCVAHIFALQQQVVNLEAELVLVQAHLSVLDPQPAPPPPPPPAAAAQVPLQFSRGSGLLSSHSSSPNSSNSSTVFYPPLQQLQPAVVLPNAAGNHYSQLPARHVEDEEVEALAREYFSKYSNGMRFRWPDSQ